MDYTTPNFIDVYLPYLKILLETSHEGATKLQIYEFSAQYFEDEVNERKARSSEKDKAEAKWHTIDEEIPVWHQYEIITPEFSYESLLILTKVPSSFGISMKESESDAVVQDEKRTNITDYVQESFKPSRVRSPPDREARLTNANLVDGFEEFSLLLPEYISVMSGYLKFLDQADESSGIQAQLQKANTTSQMNIERTDGSPRVLGNNYRNLDVSNRRQKSEVSSETKSKDTIMKETDVSSGWKTSEASTVSKKTVVRELKRMDVSSRIKETGISSGWKIFEPSSVLKKTDVKGMKKTEVSNQMKTTDISSESELNDAKDIWKIDKDNTEQESHEVKKFRTVETQTDRNWRCKNCCEVSEGDKYFTETSEVLCRSVDAYEQPGIFSKSNSFSTRDSVKVIENSDPKSGDYETLELGYNRSLIRLIRNIYQKI